jgi:hypothetical protein
MAKAMSEGAEVRHAFDGPKLDHDKLIGHIGARIKEEHERSSDGSESAAKVSAFLEETGLNSQAYSWMKTIVKKLPKKDGMVKAMDVIRSIEAALPMVKAHVSGQNTAEMFPDQEKQAAQEAAPAKKQAVSKTIARFAPKVVGGKADAAPEPTGDAVEDKAVDLAQDEDDFDRQLAAATDQ